MLITLDRHYATEHSCSTLMLKVWRRTGTRAKQVREIRSVPQEWEATNRWLSPSKWLFITLNSLQTETVPGLELWVLWFPEYKEARQKYRQSTQKENPNQNSKPFAKSPQNSNKSNKIDKNLEKEIRSKHMTERKPKCLSPRPPKHQWISNAWVPCWI